LTAWRKEQSRDRFFRRAHEEGFRARSVYKLTEIVEKHRVLRPGDAVVDLGAAPGSWSQAAAQIVGRRGRVVAVDLTEIAPLPDVVTIQADITHPATLQAIRDALGRAADAVISDAAPATTGIAVTDHARSLELCQAALQIARELLRPGGSFVTKVFRGSDFDAFVADVKRHFAQVRTVVPDATRKESRECFVVGLGFKG
jgi:23S rRNA (uridine2552-2'-O)-methyltransferase